MTSREIKKVKQTLSDTPLQNRPALRESLIERLTTEVPHLQQQADAVQREYLEWQSRWSMKRLQSDTPVVPVREDVWGYRRYLAGGVITILAEMGLAAWIFTRQEVPWTIGIIATLVLTWIAHVGFGAVYDIECKEHLPREVWRKVRLVIYVVFGIFVVAGAVSILARYIEAPGIPVAVILWAFSVSLWTVTLCLLLLAAHFLCGAQLFGQTGRYVRNHGSIERLIGENQRFLDELQREQKEEDQS